MALTMTTAIVFFLTSMNTNSFEIVAFYVILWVLFLVVLKWHEDYYPNRSGDIVAYDYEMDSSRLPYLIGGLLMLLVINIFVVALGGGIEFHSVFYIPRPSALLALNLPPIVSVLGDILFNITCVASMEEGLKLIAMLTQFRYYRYVLGWDKTKATAVSVVTASGFWSILHLFLSYTGPLAYWYTLGAFLSGIALFFVLKQSRNLLAVILCHGGYNALLILSQLVK